jgi:hypothetical protein
MNQNEPLAHATKLTMKANAALDEIVEEIGARKYHIASALIETALEHIGDDIWAWWRARQEKAKE